MSTDERTVQYHIQEYERCLKTIFPICSKVAGCQIDKSFAIMDVKGQLALLLETCQECDCVRCGVLPLNKGRENDDGERVED